MSKYYIPSKDEFFYGFLFEWKRDFEGESDWKECDYDPTTHFIYIKDTILDSHVCPNCTYIYTDDSIPIYCALSFLNKSMEWRKKLGIEIRVKYLDKGDIESLGFKYIMTSYDGYYIKDDIELGIIWDHKRYQIKRKGEGIIFVGAIKNKSELVKLLKQLNIE
jgi:hypothetical protein